ncbi:MAG: DMT family transporter [Chromatiales bacterium]
MRILLPTPGPRGAAYLMLTLTPLFWAGNAVIGRAMREDLPPVTFAFWRWTLAAALLLPFTLPLLRRDWVRIRRGWRILLILGLLGITSFNTLLYHAAHTTGATNIALIQTLTPTMIAGIGLLVYGDRISARAAGGILLGTLGALVVIARGSWSTLTRLDFVSGDLWMLLAVFLYSYHSVLLRRRPDTHPLSYLTVVFLIGVVTLAPLYLWEWSVKGAPGLTPAVAGSVLYAAAFASILAYLFWVRGIELIGAHRAGVFLTLLPLFAALLAVVFLRERLHAFHFAGGLLILAGFWLVHRDRATP